MQNQPWSVETEAVAGGRRYELKEDGTVLGFQRLLGLLQESIRFCDWYRQLLTASGFDGFFWENPPLHSGNLDRAAEFVLMEAPALVGMAPDGKTFRSHFGATPDASVSVFRNLGGDALLVVPDPIGHETAYSHLAVFLRQGPPGQIRELWRTTARAVREQIGSKPLWLSTSGTGVAWLHVRLDRRPKYYQYQPYRQEV